MTGEDPKSALRASIGDAEELQQRTPANETATMLTGQPSHFYDERLEGCPIQPLGVGPNMFFFIDSLGHFQEVEVSKLGRTKMLQMIGDSRWLWKRFPSFNKDGAQTGWKINLFSECLIDACSRLRSFDPAGRVRGAGMWQDKEGQIVTHCGDRLYVGRKAEKPGLHDGIVYPARAPLPGPIFEDYGDTGRDLFELLKTWNWQRGDLDVKLVMGWIANAFYGGATSWRPPLWISGDAGTGKSAIQQLLHEIFGPFLLQSADASQAGLFQTLHYDCLPVALDELEPEADPRKADGIMKLMRLSTSGAAMLRGGQDGKAMGFQARSAFLFSSILTPGMNSAETSRLALCELGPVKAKRSLGDLSRWRERGRRILGRLIIEWPRYTATFTAYRDELLASGHSARSADQFGALGAGYDVMMRDGFDISAIKAWAAGLPATQLRETAGYRSDSMNCLSRMLTSSPPQIFRQGKTETIAYWLRRSAREQIEELADGAKDAQNVLASLGLRAWIDGRDKNIALPDRPKWVCVANSHEGTAKIFEGSHWQTKPGATGVWVQALKRVHGAWTGVQWIDGASYRCVLLPWDVVFPAGDKDGQVEMDPYTHEPAPQDDYEPGARG